MTFLQIVKNTVNVLLQWRPIHSALRGNTNRVRVNGLRHPQYLSFVPSSSCVSRVRPILQNRHMGTNPSDAKSRDSLRHLNEQTHTLGLNNEMPMEQHR